MDTDERNLWGDVGHFAGMAAAMLSESEEFQFRIRGEQSQERERLATKLCRGIVKRLSEFAIHADARFWYDDAAGCYTCAVNQSSEAPPPQAPRKPWWKLW